MYVKKFEGETLDETLKSVKRELGPDAIILKTVTNKGLKGAFKKKRIEITAAISDQSYTNKAKVDQVLSEDQRETFYQTSASDINKTINRFNRNTPAKTGEGTATYGSLGLNKVVNSVSKASKKIQNSLDDFLNTEEEDSKPGHNKLDSFIADRSPVLEANSHDNDYQQEIELEKRRVNEVSATLGGEIKSQKHQIDLLEKKLFELTEKLTQSETGKYEEPQGLMELRTSLRTLELEEKIIQKIIKKANFELSPDDLSGADTIYEFALRELSELIQVAMPHFSQAGVNQPVTALISDSTSGQASMAIKLAVLQEDVKIIRFRQREIDQGKSEFTSRIFKLDISEVESLSHLMSEARKAKEDGKSLILDLRLDFKEENESKKFIETLKRSFEQVEFLVTLSAIHSELYNRKILSKYRAFSNGVIITHIDQCLSFGALVNTHYAYQDLPLMFYGTGAVVPDDVESATAERLLAGMFQL